MWHLNVPYIVLLRRVTKNGTSKNFGTLNFSPKNIWSPSFSTLTFITHVWLCSNACHFSPLEWPRHCRKPGPLGWQFFNASPNSASIYKYTAYIHIHLYIYTSIHLYIYTSIHIYISTYLSISKSKLKSISISLSLSIYLSIYLSIHIYIYIYTYTYVYLYIFKSTQWICNNL